MLFESKNMSIPNLEASSDDLYTIYTFILPNKPVHSNSLQDVNNKNDGDI